MGEHVWKKDHVPEKCDECNKFVRSWCQHCGTCKNCWKTDPEHNQPGDWCLQQQAGPSGGTDESPTPTKKERVQAFFQRMSPSRGGGRKRKSRKRKSRKRKSRKRKATKRKATKRKSRTLRKRR